jgi:predicted GH43/DUF377 family glycosyl hydrolase
VDGWVIDRTPTLLADPDRYPEELWGIEDPRITYLEEIRKSIAYTAFGKSGPGVARFTQTRSSRVKIEFPRYFERPRRIRENFIRFLKLKRVRRDFVPRFFRRVTYGEVFFR